MGLVNLKDVGPLLFLELLRLSVKADLQLQVLVPEVLQFLLVVELQFLHFNIESRNGSFKLLDDV